MLKVAVLGVGGISGAHIPVWLGMKEVEIIGICDVRPQRMEKYPELKHYTAFEEMIAAEKPDILDICLPTYLHPEYAIKALDMGIHVICEKPISMNRADVKAIYDTAKKNNVKFMVAQVLRFWPEYEFVKEAYDTGKYGKLLYGTMSRLGNMPLGKWENWMADEKRSGLVPYDLHIHDLDFLIYALGQPTDIRCSRVRKDQAYDYLSVLYTFGDIIINTEAGWDCTPHPFGSSFRFQFEDALLAIENKKLIIRTRDKQVIEFSPEAQGESGDKQDLNIVQSNAYANEIHYFVDCVVNDKEPAKVVPEQLETVIDIIDQYISI